MRQSDITDEKPAGREVDATTSLPTRLMGPHWFPDLIAVARPDEPSVCRGFKAHSHALRV